MERRNESHECQVCGRVGSNILLHAMVDIVGVSIDGLKPEIPQAEADA